jgi:hypothetical protein
MLERLLRPIPFASLHAPLSTRIGSSVHKLSPPSWCALSLRSASPPSSCRIDWKCLFVTSRRSALSSYPAAPIAQRSQLDLHPAARWLSLHLSSCPVKGKTTKAAPHPLGFRRQEEPVWIAHASREKIAHDVELGRDRYSQTARQSRCACPG